MTRYKTVRNRLIRIAGKTIDDYGLIHAGDKILVAVSGGKDSWTLLDLLCHFRSVSPVRFDLFPVTINPGFPDFDHGQIEKVYAERFNDLPWTVIRTEINRTVSEKNSPGKYPCAFCARLRRGALYRAASKRGCNRLALGHHADDAVETMLVSGLFEGNLVSLPPVLKAEDHDITVIRPLIRIWEDDIRLYCRETGFPMLSCGHAMQSGGKREYVKMVLKRIEQDNPKSKRNLLAALHKINPGRFLDNKWL